MKRIFIKGFFGAAGLGLLGFGAWLLSLPAQPAARDMPPIPRAETEAILAALKPTRRVPASARPLVAIIGVNAGTETTDYLMPYGILKRAGVADVVALATKPGPVSLYPALTVMPEATLADFDARHPSGADYVIVPAMHRDDDPAVLAWITNQASKGAMIIGVCAGARIVAAAGLLEGRRATTHWYYRTGMLARHPSIRYVADRRVVVDGNVATTTGITASLTLSLTLIEAIAGRDKAAEIARDLGVAAWDTRHDSNAFQFTREFALTAMGNTAAVWAHETLGIALVAGIDEVSLALVADAWSRTYRSRAVTYAETASPQTTRNGLQIVPDDVTSDWPERRRLPAILARPAEELDRTLDAIEARHGEATADFVARQMEYQPR